ncbi:MAG: Fe-S cluster assembly protein SufD [Candidatus Neomarinimicrobiota bacterium]
MIPTFFQPEFSKILDREYFSKKAHPIREQAFETFLGQGFPNKKWEDWRFTNLSKIKKGNFRISDITDAPKQEIGISKYGIQSFHTAIIYNGHYQEKISSIPEGIKILSNLDYMENNDWKIKQPSKSSFDLLNTAFMDSGICLIVEGNKKIEKPLRILFICSGNENIMVSPRIHIDAKESSALTIVEQHVGKCNEYLYNGSFIINIEKNAKINHSRIQNNSKETINIGNLHVQQKKSSNYVFNQFAFGGSLSRMNIYSDLIGEGANCSINGLNLSNGNQHMDSYVVTNHHKAHCTSSQNFKFILKDQSSGVFNGRSVVHNGAQKTDSNQSNKNLLLSDDALMNSNPQLEIYTDDVKCTHGSSTGALEPDAIFYMQSRGIDKESARALLVHGFASEIINRFNGNDIHKYITNYFDEWINT